MFKQTYLRIAAALSMVARGAGRAKDYVPNLIDENRNPARSSMANAVDPVVRKYQTGKYHGHRQTSTMAKAWRAFWAQQNSKYPLQGAKQRALLTEVRRAAWRAERYSAESAA